MDERASEAIQAKYERRVERERRARLQAEELLEVKSLELYESNQQLIRLFTELEQRVTERTHDLAMARQRAVSLAERDQLTGIANRIVFNRALDAAAGKANERGPRFALILIDLDNFKDINDSLGHEAGDLFLKEVAYRLDGLLRSKGFVARLGGDEFAAILTDGVDDAALAPFAERLRELIHAPVDYREHVLHASCSIGIAVYPDHANEGGELQRYADVALYLSKAAGGDGFTIFDDTIRRDYDERHVLGSELKTAIAAGHIEPWFQPIVEGETGALVGIEALARWQHPSKGIIGPATFLKLAEERALMNDIFAAMLRASCRAARPWLEAGIIRFVSVNVSPSQFKSGTLTETIPRILAEFDVPPSALTIEITEELLLNDLGRSSAQLDVLARGGIRIALDDFGVGYSNIAYLGRLPIHKLKLDRLLTANVGLDFRARGILRAIVEIARLLDLEVIAEGVEDVDQAKCLGELGCRHLQGFLFGKPMPADDFSRFASERRLPKIRAA